VPSLAAPCAPGVPEEEEDKPGRDNDDVKTVADASNGYTLLPNPSRGDLIIRQNVVHDAAASVKVLNYAGQEVYSGALEFADGSANLNIENAIPGMYMVVLVDDKGETTTFKVVVQ
jgi:hypothetical protein